jgi:hypothetical protein
MLVALKHLLATELVLVVPTDSTSPLMDVGNAAQLSTAQYERVSPLLLLDAQLAPLVSTLTMLASAPPP